ncbi:MAG: rhomboid family intramembrane serine protease [Akkermansiaceae bacterium]|nr:rhomboid family intramembrane serine protease [Akkermansiaceae bacterium]
MGYEDRDYMRPDGLGPQRPAFFEGAPITKQLIIANVVIFFIGALMTPSGAPLHYMTSLDIWGHFSITEGLYHFQIWRLFTFQFLHGDGGHLLGNMIGMVFFAPHVERWMGSRPFVFYYLLCGIAGALFYTILFFVPGMFDYPATVPLVGASAGLFGILAAFYKIAPNARILLFFCIPMKMKTFAIAYFALQVITVIFGLDNAGGAAGHLGGALLGLSFIKYKPLRTWLINVSEIGTGSSSSPKVRQAKEVREIEQSPIELNKEVDRILEKISDHGIQSLNDKERQTLDKARKR